MKIIFILSFKIMLVCLMLLKPVLVSSYLLKDSNANIILALAENEEDKSEKSSLELDDEIYHSINLEWNANVDSVASIKSLGVSQNIEEHIREIVPPPPQG